MVILRKNNFNIVLYFSSVVSSGSYIKTKFKKKIFSETCQCLAAKIYNNICPANATYTCNLPPC